MKNTPKWHLWRTGYSDRMNNINVWQTKNRFLEFEKSDSKKENQAAKILQQIE